MNKLEYTSFIKQLLDGTIKAISFSVEGYSHYNNCKIFRIEETIHNGRIITRIEVQLTDDNSETVSFFNEFKEDIKLFKMSRKGSFTLKQLWNKIQIMNIEYPA